MPGRNANPGSYRYGFQNQETDPEMLGGAVAFKYRVHDPRIGRFLSVDPLEKEYPWNSPYAFAENKVIQFIELEGAEVSAPAYVHENGYSTAIDQTGSQSMNEGQIIKTLQLIHKARNPLNPSNLTLPSGLQQQTMSDNTFGPLNKQFQIFSHNFNNTAELFVPGYEIAGKLGRGEEISKTDIGFEVLGIIPVAKFAGVAFKGSVKVVSYGFKHVPGKNVPWETIIKSTKSGPAKFAQGLNVSDLTVEAFENGTKVGGTNSIVYDAGKVIGANSGKETRFMRVDITEMADGTKELHSHPISKESFDKYTKKATE